MKLFQILTKVDIFGQNILPNLKGRTNIGTKLGGSVTILFVSSIFAYFCVLLKALADHTPVEKSS